MGKPHKDGFTLDVPPSKSNLRTVYECKAGGGDSEVARFTLYEGGTGELAYLGSVDNFSTVCPLHWKKAEDSRFSIDLNTQQYLKLFFNQTDENKKLIHDGKFQFTTESKFSISTSHCERVSQKP